MLQNHHAVSKYYKDGTWSVISVHYIKRTLLYRETIKYYIYIPFTLVHILGIPVCKRSEANYTSLPKIMHRYSSSILKIQLM